MLIPSANDIEPLNTACQLQPHEQNPNKQPIISSYSSKIAQYAVPNRRKDYDNGEGFGSSASRHLRIAPGVPTRSVDLVQAEKF